MKTPILKRSKTGDSAAVPPIVTKNSRSSTSLTYKTSFDELRSPDGRQKLREQLSSQFPESYTSSLKSSPSQTDMNWLNVGQNVAAKSSSSSVESAGNGPNRLSRVPESNAAIDVESAINILQELKKTATPEQLVALHKALLPTRDSIASIADSPSGQRQSLIRQKSMLPAGLATRGGASDDLLKRQEDVAPVIKKKSGRSDGHQRLQSKSSIAALDLADDATNPLTSQRAATPSDDQYFGAYRPGTLRITNGAASPEPSMRPSTSGEVTPTTASIGQITASRDRAGSLAKTVFPDLSAQEPIVDRSRRRTESDRVEPQAVFPRARSRDPSQSRQYRSTRSQEPVQSSTPLAQSREPSLSRQPVQAVQSTTPVAQSREPSLSRQPLQAVQSSTPDTRTQEPSLSRQAVQVETRASRPSLVASKKASIDTLVRRSIESIAIRKSFDDGRVSPIDAPRFARRWSHRASQISQEYMTDCEVPISPFEDSQAAAAFAQRLSTVYDGEDAENTANETPEAALSKLEGSLKESEEETRRPSDEPSARRSEERRSLKATAQGLNNATRPSPVTHYSNSPGYNKKDSGYASDASHHSLPQLPSHEPSSRYSGSKITYEHTQLGFRKTVHDVDPGADDIESLYTLEQVLKMPSLTPGPKTSARPEASRKHTSLLKLTGRKKSSLTVSKTPLEPESPADALPLAPPNEAGSSPTADSKTIKPAKKLQKRVPEDVRKQRKAQRESEKLAALKLDIPIDLSELASPAPVYELATASETMLPSSPMIGRAESTPAGALSELEGDSPQDTDESTAAPKRSLSRKQSRKSRRRSRQNTVTAADEDKTESKKRSFSLGRKRSKSRRRSGSLTPKRKSQEEAPAVPSIAALSAKWAENGSQESIPLYSDYSSVARSLGTNPYDLSTGMFKRGAQSPGPVIDQLQSPHQISTFVSRTKSGGLKGMDSAMASELARMKSRDVAMQNNEELYDRPRMATPKKRSQQDMIRSRNTMPNAIMVEQRSPGWNAKPVFRANPEFRRSSDIQRSSFESSEFEFQQRPHSIADSIPSLPELPADAEAKAAKSAEYLAKRERILQASPILAESPSPASSPDPSSSGHPGFSSESVADAVAKAVEARRTKQADQVKQGQQEDRLRPMGPRMNSNSSSSTGRVSLQIHGIEERPYSDASASILIGVGSDVDDQVEHPNIAAARNDEPEREPSIWDRQASLWRQRRESIGKSLGKPIEDDVAVEDEQPAASPAIVVSRHVTPSALDSLPSGRRRRTSASEHANAYRDLIGSESDSFDEPPLLNRGSTQSTTTVTTRSSTSTVVVENAVPAKAYRATVINRDRSPGGRVRTPSGSYHPYNPGHAAQAEQSRAGSLAQLEGRDVRGTQSMDVQRRVHHQQSDTLESILGRYDRTLSPVPGSEAGDVESPERPKNAPRAHPVIDRYSGGLQYGYQRGVGLQGSSGMRTSMSAQSPRGGNQFSEHFGLDLGDVPVFLRRAGV